MMKMIKEIRLPLLAVFLLLSLLVSGCQGGSDSGGEGSSTKPAVLSITILDAKDTAVTESAIRAYTGSSLKFKVNVWVRGGAPKKVEWAVSNNSSQNTAITQDGLLTISGDEKPGVTLTVTVTSRADETQTASVYVMLEAHPQEPGPPGTPPPDPVPYTREYYASENFDVSDCAFYDKFEGDSLDLSKWGYQNGNGSQYGNSGWGNNESQAYAAENVVVEDGVLKLIARSERKYGRNYTSGKIVTANSQGDEAIGEPPEGAGKKFVQTYGRFEAKIRMTHSFQGAWPAFWMMPADNAYGGWPRSGEIDIMEMVGVKPNHASSTLHMKPNWGTWQSQYQYVDCTFRDSADFTDWHVFGVRWTATEITFLLDGYETRTLTRNWWNSAWYADNGFSSTSAPFDKDFHLILNLALDSGQFSADNALPSNPDLPAGMEVEWIRCYTLENDPWPKSFGAHPASLRRNGGN